MSRYGWMLSLLLLVALVSIGCSPIPPPPPGSFPDRILFIGTSFTYYNDGVDRHLQGMAASASPRLPIEADSETKSSTPLSGLWQSSTVQEKIREDNWDVVVVQGRLTMGEDPESYEEYMRKFDELIRDVGARTVLFMNWQFGSEQGGGPPIAEIAQVTSHTGAVVNAEVAPVGLAWERAMAENPDIELYAPDRRHPSVHGTYLTAAVFYATLFDRSPVGLPYHPVDLYPPLESVEPERRQVYQEALSKLLISQEDAEFLQRIAWETVQDYREQQGGTH